MREDIRFTQNPHTRMLKAALLTVTKNRKQPTCFQHGPGRKSHCVSTCGECHLEQVSPECWTEATKCKNSTAWTLSLGKAQLQEQSRARSYGSSGREMWREATGSSVGGCSIAWACQWLGSEQSHTMQCRQEPRDGILLCTNIQ